MGKHSEPGWQLRQVVAYHANPLDAKTIGPLIQDHAVSFVLATPTFLQLYLRGCSPEQFGSVRLIMVGAEKLPDRLAAAFEEKFSIRSVEGYGTPECAPVVHQGKAYFFSALAALAGGAGVLGGISPCLGVTFSRLGVTSASRLRTAQWMPPKRMF